VPVVEFFESVHVPLKKLLYKHRIGRHFAGILGCQDRQEHGLGFFVSFETIRHASMDG
jgi:hypothetical protein